MGREGDGWRGSKEDHLAGETTPHPVRKLIISSILWILIHILAHQWSLVGRTVAGLKMNQETRQLLQGTTLVPY